VLLADFCKERRIGGDDLPFMLKILSTAEPISLQNHPSDQDVIDLGLAGNGKFECWSILEADDYARAYLGLRAGEEISVLRNLATDTDPLSHFNEYFPRRGDIIKLEPGLVHSTTGRLLFYEIQQKSDHTFRLYDFGRGRALHSEQAIHCVREQKPDISLFSAGLATEKFSVAYHEVMREKEITPAGSSFSVVTWFGRAVELSCGGEEFILNWGDSLLLTSQKKCHLSRIHGDPEERLAGLPMIDMLFEAYT
jgi:mannose-6-phosphate isomerase